MPKYLLCNPIWPLRLRQDTRTGRGCCKCSIKKIWWGGEVGSRSGSGLPVKSQALQASELHWLILSSEGQVKDSGVSRGQGASSQEVLWGRWRQVTGRMEGRWVESKSTVWDPACLPDPSPFPRQHRASLLLGLDSRWPTGASFFTQRKGENFPLPHSSSSNLALNAAQVRTAQSIPNLKYGVKLGSPNGLVHLYLNAELYKDPYIAQRTVTMFITLILCWKGG